ncbi:MAG: alanine--tRNA ligase, partial [Ferruginibacter sp.]
MMTSAEIRQQFLDFFKSKEHVIVPSAPIVVKNDPTLLFTNAGMNQFKDYFLGNKPAPYSRVADTQKCLRVSGKHNDLEEVGVDTYHHTMFEMLGNWSFGDPANPEAGYFKNEAITWSWELLTGIFKLPKDRLYATVFEGDEKEGLPASAIALKKWMELVPQDHIVFGNKKDNFWEMGDTGPCGPCSEIHFDLRSDEERELLPGHLLVNKDHPQVIEIWNNVFIQFNRKKDGSLEPLPAKHVDTGMGFERLVRVIQGKTSNYDTDVFSGTLQATEKITGKKYSGGDDKQSVAFRVIADHIRAISFTIADGQLPSNTGAGYVIRRILRRAVRYYYSYLDYKQPLLHQLLPVIAKQFEDVFPELTQQLDFVGKVVKEEEEAFLRTVDNGLSMLDQATKNITGEEAFRLYDTFGFPLDLTKLVATEKGLTVDEAGFEAEMKKQKDRSRAAAVLDTEDWVTVNDIPSSKFVGYDNLTSNVQVVKYRKVSGKGKEQYQIIL